MTLCTGEKRITAWFLIISLLIAASVISLSAKIIDGESARHTSDDPTTLEARIAEASGYGFACEKDTEISTLSNSMATLSSLEQRTVSTTMTARSHAMTILEFSTQTITTITKLP